MIRNVEKEIQEFRKLNFDDKNNEDYILNNDNFSFATVSGDSFDFTENYAGTVEVIPESSGKNIDAWKEVKAQRCFITIVLLIFECGLICSVGFLITGLLSKKYMKAVHSIAGQALILFLIICSVLLLLFFIFFYDHRYKRGWCSFSLFLLFLFPCQSSMWLLSTSIFEWETVFTVMYLLMSTIGVAVLFIQCVKVNVKKWNWIIYIGIAVVICEIGFTMGILFFFKHFSILDTILCLIATLLIFFELLISLSVAMYRHELEPGMYFYGTVLMIFFGIFTSCGAKF